MTRRADWIPQWMLELPRPSGKREVSSFARRVWEAHLRVLNEQRRKAGLLEIRQQYRLRELAALWKSGKSLPEKTYEDLYVEFLEWLVGEMQRDAETGWRVTRAGILGEHKAHGTPEEKAALTARMQASANALRSQHPDWSITQIRAGVAEQHIVSAKTVQRRVKIANPASPKRGPGKPR